MTTEETKEKVFEELALELQQQGFRVERQDRERPWGGFFVIDEEQAQRFADTYFNGISVEDLRIAGKLSPKVLIVAPEKRLSWQYHHRRAEIWQVIRGTVDVVTSDTNEEKYTQTLEAGQQVRLQQGERHRLVGRSGWGVLAEIWQHTDKNNPSDEADIVRVQDDFGR